MLKVHSFKSDISKIKLPKKFTFPYNYIPHKLAKIASLELQEYLENQTDFKHNFGILNYNDTNSIGKMFGVLVVKDNQNNIGFLAAFSGKLADKNLHNYFVPPVFNILNENGFYKKTEEELNRINKRLDILKNDDSFNKLSSELKDKKNQTSELISVEKAKIKERQKLRKQNFKQLNPELLNDEVLNLQKRNNQLKINESFYLKEYELYLNNKLNSLETKVESYSKEIEKLKQERAKKSAWVQQEIFKHYSFLNSAKKTKNLLDIFVKSNQNIPAGAGDCCAPKLLQFAFKNNLTPICMAEFWWGKPLTTSVRKHQQFYPACKGKCKPILTHMLQGLAIDENPLFNELSKPKELEIVYEDNELAIVNKPYDLLTVSGTEIEDSVEFRVKKLWQNASGPMIVHRLDMSTSGVLIIAKTKESHKIIQDQFKNKIVCKRYVAILNGTLNENEGFIELPLKVDFHHRPKQMVCYENGKKAITKWKAIKTENNKTRVHFFPITGRTHQLRMHAAHFLGLNTPILGDDLYGEKLDRLYLHAEKITFIHPKTNKQVEFEVPCPF